MHSRRSSWEPLKPTELGLIRPAAGFTLIEMMAAMGVLVLLLVFVGQVVNQTTASTQAAGKRIDTASMCRVGLDRLGADLAGKLPATDSALVVIKADGTQRMSDSVVMIGNVRTEDRGIAAGNVRLGAIAYAVITVNDKALSLPSAPMLSRGNGTITWSGNNAAQVNSDTLTALTTAVGDVMNSQQQMVSFEPLAEGIFGCVISFLLSDGSMANTPPRDKTFPISSDPNVYSVAVSSVNSDDSTNRYVKALVVTVVALDQKTLKIVGPNGSSLGTLAKVFGLATAGASAGTTAAQQWDIKTNATLRTRLSPPAFPAPVIAGIQVYQRYFYVQ